LRPNRGVIMQRNNPRLAGDYTIKRWAGGLIGSGVEARATLRAEAMLASNTG